MSIPFEWRETERSAGSDGIERNLAEWYQFISETIESLSNPSTPLEEDIKKARHEVSFFFQNGGNFEKSEVNFPNLKSFIGDAAHDYFRTAIKDSYDRFDNDERRLEEFVGRMQSFVTQLKSSLKGTGQAIQVGNALGAYIEAYDALPDQPKTLFEFTKNHQKWEGKKPIPRKTIHDHLPNFKLGSIVKGNG